MPTHQGLLMWCLAPAMFSQDSPDPGKSQVRAELPIAYLRQCSAVSIMCVESREWMKLGGKAFFCFTVSGFLQDKAGHRGAGPKMTVLAQRQCHPAWG